MSPVQVLEPEGQPEPLGPGDEVDVERAAAVVAAFRAAGWDGFVVESAQGGPEAVLFDYGVVVAIVLEDACAFVATPSRRGATIWMSAGPSSP